MGRQIPEDYPDPGGHGDHNLPPPKYTEPVFPDGRDETAQSMAEQGKALPIAYGTVKLPVLVIEKLVPLQQDPPQWTALTQYPAGYIAQNGGNAYEVKPGGIGTSAASGGPTGTGTNIADGSLFWTYRQQLPMPIYVQRFLGALCEGEALTGLAIWIDKEKFAALTATIFPRGIELKLGPDAGGQTLIGSFDSTGYQHTVVIQPLASGIGVLSGTQKELPNIAVELKALAFGASTPDASPADIINDLLTHVRRGVLWPGTRVDSSITGSAAAGYRVYTDAAGLRISIALTEAKRCIDLIDMILEATNSDGVWSGGALKVVPLGDQPIAAPVYGATGYVPANTPVYDLTLDDLLDKAQPVQVFRKDDADCFSECPVEYIDRAQGYVRTSVSHIDQLNSDDRGGKRTAPTLVLPIVFPDGTRPTMLSKIRAQRSLNVRNTYTFRLPPWSILLEPTDIVTLPAEVIGVKTAVRITSMQENPGQGFTFTAEDFPAGAQAAAAYTPQAGDGYQANEAGTVSSAPPLTGVVTTADPNVKVGPYVFSSAWRRLLQAIDGDAISQGGVGTTFYRGSIDPTGAMLGAPIIFDGSGERLRLFCWPGNVLSGGVNLAVTGANNMTLLRMALNIRPKTNADNLDALEFVQLHFYTDLGTDTGHDWRQPLRDRAYGLPGTPNNVANDVEAYFEVSIPGFPIIFNVAPFLPNMYVRASIWNVYGKSADRDWGFVVNVANAGTSREGAPGATIPGVGGGGGASGSGGSSYCPTPDARLLLAGGGEVRAGDLVDGVEVIGFRENDFKRELTGTVRYVSHELVPMIYAVKLTDGRVLRYSKNHRLCSLTRNCGWIMVQDLKSGEKLVARGEADAVVEQVIRDGPGHVVGFVVEGPHTYFTDDVLSHNAKPSVP